MGSRAASARSFAVSHPILYIHTYTKSPFVSQAGWLARHGAGRDRSGARCAAACFFSSSRPRDPGHCKTLLCTGPAVSNLRYISSEGIACMNACYRCSADGLPGRPSGPPPLGPHVVRTRSGEMALRLRENKFETDSNDVLGWCGTLRSAISRDLARQLRVSWIPTLLCALWLRPYSSRTWLEFMNIIMIFEYARIKIS